MLVLTTTIIIIIGVKILQIGMEIYVGEAVVGKECGLILI